MADPKLDQNRKRPDVQRPTVFLRNVSAGSASARSAFFRTVIFRSLCFGVVAGFLFYLAWNIVWVTQGQVPPSIMTYFTGWPSPTTGGTRSFLALTRGEIAESIRYNAMTVPILLLLISTLACLFWNGTRKRKWSIPAWLGMAWGVVLITAWILKLFGDRQYW